MHRQKCGVAVPVMKRVRSLSETINCKEPKTQRQRHSRIEAEAGIGPIDSSLLLSGSYLDNPDKMGYHSQPNPVKSLPLPFYPDMEIPNPSSLLHAPFSACFFLFYTFLQNNRL
ncbi:hypothetical protein VNO77_21903 [Canavalia gladiata]|uniref:Uncharacterized protein n=1 Tax=Canavalia gladiata TaxID=3824 RepID=A0AAN9QAA8_CANGL